MGDSVSALSSTPARFKKARVAFARAGISVLFAVLALSCVDSFSPPVGTHPFDPPIGYRAAWQQVEDCSGLQGDFARVRWFLVPQPYFRCSQEGTGNCFGLWQRPHDIYLSEPAASDSASYFTVRHEILHDLLQGGLDHPPVFSTCGLLRL